MNSPMQPGYRARAEAAEARVVKERGSAMPSPEWLTELLAEHDPTVSELLLGNGSTVFVTLCECGGQFKHHETHRAHVAETLWSALIERGLVE